MKPILPVILFLLVVVLAYGLLVPQMGFYWDELPMTWIRYELGPAALTRYFSTNRPFWGLLYQVTTRLLPQTPIYWQVFGLLWRWAATVLVWAILRQLWPGDRQIAVVAALCFLVYPGFSQQWTSFLYGHFFIVLCFLLLSFLCMLWSLRNGRWYSALTAAAVLFSALNLWMMEYFYFLELFRPFLILRAVSAEAPNALAFRLRRTLRLWAPYLSVFFLNVLWRLFIFNNQIYQPSLLQELKAAPGGTLMNLARTILTDVGTVSLAAWAQILRIPNPAVDGARTTLFYAVVVGATALAVGLYWLTARYPSAAGGREAWWAIGLGAAALLAAGGPFWLTRLYVTLGYPANRFTLPFMLGVSILIAGLLAFLPPAIRVVLVVVLISLAAGRQALWADAYRREWATQKSMFWQMFWRAPGIVPHTMVLMNEGALPLYADNSLTAALNWIYDPDNRSGSMDYALFYPTSRLGGTLHGFEPAQSITYDFIAEEFSGNTSQTLSFYYQPPGCLRLLDGSLDSDNHFIPDASLMRAAAPLSSSKWIQPQASAEMPVIYGLEPVHGWCYYFERADLAAQVGDWSSVVMLGAQAFGLNDYPNDPAERFVFIEGYAHESDWAKAIELSTESYKVSKVYMGPLLCRLWDRIRIETRDSSQKVAALAQLHQLYACSSE